MDSSSKRKFVIPCIAIGVAALIYWRSRDESVHGNTGIAPVDLQHVEAGQGESDGSGAGKPASGDHEISSLTMAQVLEMATAARQHMAEHLDDYSARFVKQEQDKQGVLGHETVIQMKVQTRLRGEDNQSPMRVYLNFEAPASRKGREVIWAEDLNDGKMVVHEVGVLLGLKRIWLAPDGIIAMRSQRYPIGEIGMVRLVEKLIERGEKDRDNPEIQVTRKKNHQFNSRSTELIQIRRGSPSDNEDEFSLAEIVIDKKRQLILLYRSFGWPENEGDEFPLLESYRYEDVDINLGLTDEDFSPDNPNYRFPAF